jgi:hypothetical protein
VVQNIEVFGAEEPLIAVRAAVEVGRLHDDIRVECRPGTITLRTPAAKGLTSAMAGRTMDLRFGAADVRSTQPASPASRAADAGGASCLPSDAPRSSTLPLSRVSAASAAGLGPRTGADRPSHPQPNCPEACRVSVTRGVVSATHQWVPGGSRGGSIESMPP